ncbi:hypothetical protein [Telluria beijingensis]|uniref:hypothetical protein n=1 Tax=Telluria beijingensis TaxID=3068633 RepID=UPI0027959074|nr:hypothetical protein [Massilia sp. REN29]
MKNVNSVQGMSTFPSHAEQAKPLGHVKSFKRVGAYASVAMLATYAIQLMNSVSAPGLQEKKLMIIASALTLLVVIPIIVLNIYSIARLRVANANNEHAPGYAQSIKKEVKAWGVPIGIVALVTVLGWSAIHSLDLYKPKSNVAQVRVATAAGA